MCACVCGCAWKFLQLILNFEIKKSKTFNFQSRYFLITPQNRDFIILASFCNWSLRYTNTMHLVVMLPFLSYWECKVTFHWHYFQFQFEMENGEHFPSKTFVVSGNYFKVCKYAPFGCGWLSPAEKQEHHMVRFQFWSSWECEVPFNCHYSHLKPYDIFFFR